MFIVNNNAIIHDPPSFVKREFGADKACKLFPAERKIRLDIRAESW